MRKKIHLFLGMLCTVGASLVLGGCSLHETSSPVDLNRVFIDARSELYQAAESNDPATRSHGIEALAQTIGPKAGQVFTQALKDENHAVRFAAAMAIGDVKYQPAKSTLEQMVEDPKTDKSVMCAVVYALFRLGDDRYMERLGILLYDDSKWVRANAALAMGKTRESSAIQPLRSLREDEQEPLVQLQLVESLALLGDTRATALLEAYTRASFMDDRLVAIPALARLNSPRSLPIMRELMKENFPPQVRVSAFGALARQGEVSPEGYDYAVRSIRDPDAVLRESYSKVRLPTNIETRMLQRLAAIALGWTDRQSAVGEMSFLLRSPDGGVRVATAMSILRLLPNYQQQNVSEPAEPASMRSTAPVVQPVAPKPAPAPIAPKPAPAPKPAAPVVQPVAPKPAPAPVTPKPAPAPKPAAPVVQPVAPKPAPAPIAPKPASAPKPTAPSSVPAAKPVVAATQPQPPTLPPAPVVIPENKPAPPAPKAAPAAPKPAASQPVVVLPPAAAPLAPATKPSSPENVPGFNLDAPRPRKLQTSGIKD